MPAAGGGGASASALTERRILAVCVARVFLFASFMTVAAVIPLITVDWGLSATAAGAVVTSFTVSYAVSLFVFSWGSDRLGAKRMVFVSAVAAAVTSLAFGLFARDWWSAMVLYALVGLAQGGLYPPLIVLIADEVSPARRGGAMGWLIASTSAGYAGSLALAGLGVALGGWPVAFVLAGLAPGVGAVLLLAALAPVPNRVHPRTDDLRVSDEILNNRESGLLVAGYTAHSWELLGMWAWVPAFLAASFVLQGAEAAGATSRGAYFGGLMHVTGAVAAFTMGRLSDRAGRRPLLIALAAAAAALSLAIGWLSALPPAALVPVVLVYAFLCLGDSPVLTTALSEAVRPGYLGGVLAWRGLLGFGIGSAAPLALGLALDIGVGAGPTVSWGLAFAILGAGGVLATACAVALRKT